MGNPGIYNDDHSSELSVCICRCATALGMTKVSLGLSLLRKSLYLGAICVLPFFFAARAAFYAEPTADVLSAMVTSVCFLIIYKKYLSREGHLPGAGKERRSV